MSELQIIDHTKYGIEENQAKELTAGLPIIREERAMLEYQYSEVLQMDIEQPETLKKARELRLKIRDNRTKRLLDWHKKAKDFFLRGGQFVDAIKNKEIAINEGMEEKLEAIEKYHENKEKERKEALHKSRSEEVAKYAEFIPVGMLFGEMSDSDFEVIKNGAIMQYEKKQEELKKAEEERIRQQEIARLHKERKEQALPYFQYWTDFEKTLNFGEQSQGDFDAFMERNKAAKAEADRIAEEQRVENERLKKEAEKRELQIQEEKKEKEYRTNLMMPFMAYIRDFNSMLELNKKEFEREFADIKKGVEIQKKQEEELAKQRYKEAKERRKNIEKSLIQFGYEKVNGGYSNGVHFIGERHYDLVDSDEEMITIVDNIKKQFELKKEKEITAALEKELREKKEAEDRAAKAEAERKEKERKEAEKLAKAPVKKQLKAWVDSFQAPNTEIDHVVAGQIKEKFEAFKAWANTKVEEI